MGCVGGWVYSQLRNCLSLACPAPHHSAHPHHRPALHCPPATAAEGKIAAFLEERLNVGVNFVLSAERECGWPPATRLLGRQGGGSRLGS